MLFVGMYYGYMYHFIPLDVRLVCSLGPGDFCCLCRASMLAYNSNIQQQPKKDNTVDYFDIVLVQTLNIYHNGAIQCGGFNSDENMFEVYLPTYFENLPITFTNIFCKFNFLFFHLARQPIFRSITCICNY